jgi:hypothetical protein
MRASASNNASDPSSGEPIPDFDSLHIPYRQNFPNPPVD